MSYGKCFVSPYIYPLQRVYSVSLQAGTDHELYERKVIPRVRHMDFDTVALPGLPFYKGQRIVIALEALEGLVSPDQDPSTAGRHQSRKLFHIGDEVKFQYHHQDLLRRPQ